MTVSSWILQVQYARVVVVCGRGSASSLQFAVGCWIRYCTMTAILAFHAMLCEVPDIWYTFLAYLGIPMFYSPWRAEWDWPQYHFFSSDSTLCLMLMYFSHSICSSLFGVLHASFKAATCSKVLYMKLLDWLHIQKVISLESFQLFIWNICGIFMWKVSNILFP